MTHQDYHKTNEADHKKRRYRLLHDLATESGFLPKGSEVRVTGKRNGFSIESLPCSHCGVKLAMQYISHVSLEVIPEMIT